MSFRCDVSGYALPGVTVALGSYRNVRSIRTRELLSDGNDDVIFAIVARGSGRLLRPGRELDLNPGDGAVSCNAITGATAEAPATLQLINIAIPFRSLSSAVRNVGDIALVPAAARTEAVRLLKSYVMSLLASDDRPRSAEVRHLVATHILDLVALAMGATRDVAETARGRGIRAARLLAMKSDIAQNANNPAISVDWLAQQHGLSPSYVRKLLDGDGTTFSEFVLEVRLGTGASATRAIRDLPACTSAAIAFEAGFSDLSYFNRTFRKRYLCTPSEARAAAQNRNSAGVAPKKHIADPDAVLCSGPKRGQESPRCTRETAMAEIRSGERVRTTAELTERAARAAAGFASLGIGRGDTVALYLRNDFPFLEASLGAGMVNAYPVPVNWHYTEDEARYLFENSGAKAIVIHSDLVEPIRAAIPRTCRCWSFPRRPRSQAPMALRLVRDAGAGAGLGCRWLAGFRRCQAVRRNRPAR
jgi:AraC-like DNA-binding protein